MISVPSQAITPTSATNASRPTSRRPGCSTGRVACGASRSACSRTSRAASAPDAGTITSRGPAASMSGTSKPAERRTIDGIPSSSSRPWTISASAWWRALATRTSSPSVNCGLILRARSRAALTGSSTPGRVAWTSGIPQSGQNRSSGGCVEAQLGQTSGSPAIDVDLDLLDDAVVDAVGTYGRLAVTGHADDQPLHARPATGEVDVRLRRIGVRARVRVVDRAHLEATGLDLVDRAVHLESVDLEPQRAGGDVGRLVHGHGRAVAHRDHAAALVGEVAARVRDDPVEQRAPDAHYSVLSTGRSSSSSRRSLSPLRESRNSRMPFPIERPTSGSFFGPSTISAMARMTMSSSGPTLGMRSA